MKKIVLLSLFFLPVVQMNSYAQHEHHTPAKDTTRKVSKPGKDSSHITHKNEHAQHAMSDVPMSHAYSLNLPMNRNGSGTSWLPDAAPMYGIMWHSKKWMYMLHGNVFLRYTNQDIGNKGSRGGARFDAPNWFMLMAQTKVGKKGLFHYEAMISLDRLTEGGNGYPLLFQTGESWKGEPLIDRQHPHDLFAGLSVGYTQALSKKADVFLYLGYPGEPALGSVAFMHRTSSLNGPDAPITHHWNDGTHITFGVATIGIRYDNLKLEASSFTGREPDEDRYNFDKPLFDSWSTRLSYNPGKNWALQASYGFIKEPEALHPGENVNRITASAIAAYPLAKEKSINATLLWAVNKSKGHDGENAVLAEANLTMRRTNVYTRYEWVQKSSEELNLDASFDHDALHPVNVLSVGAGYDIFKLPKVNIAIGGQLSVYATASALEKLYGKNPLGAQVFIRVYPALMKM